MTTSVNSTVAEAETLLRTKLRPMRQDIHYTGKYETSRGLRLMINRQVGFIGVFTERYPGAGVLSGVELNKRSPGHYGPHTPRARSVGEDPRLGLGNEAFYIRCETLAALENLVNWYQDQ